MKDVIGLAAGAVTLLTLSALAMSVAYEWGYFSMVGLDLIRLASTTDYLTNAVTWLPIAILMAACAHAIWWAIRRSERWLPRDELLKIETFARGETKVIRYNSLLMPLTGFIAFLFFPPGGREIWIAMGFMALWWALFKWMFTHPLSPDFPSPIRNFVFWAPAVAAWLFAMGTMAAVADLRRQEPDYELLRTGVLVPDKVIVLRSFDKGLLFRNPELSSNEFLKWADVKSLRREATTSYASIICRVTGWACIPESRSPQW